MTIKAKTRIHPWCVKAKEDFTLVVYGSDATPHLEFRPAYEPGIGPVLDIYKVSTLEPQFLARVHVRAMGNLARCINVATNAALRMAARASKTPSK